jgi:hypothetical protein
MNPFLTAGLARLEEIYDDLLALLNRADEASLDWKPPVADTNSTAVLVKHISVSTASWLSRALDEPMARDRDAEFRFSGSRDELIAIVNAARATSRDQFARLDSVDPGAMRHYARITKPEQTEFTVAWCIAHALVHTAEHWGEIQLIQQLFAAR